VSVLESPCAHLRYSPLRRAAVDGISMPCLPGDKDGAKGGTALMASDTAPRPSDSPGRYSIYSFVTISVALSRNRGHSSDGVGMPWRGERERERERVRVRESGRRHKLRFCQERTRDWWYTSALPRKLKRCLITQANDSIRLAGFSFRFRVEL
jgi:hypothetical protein